MNRQVMVIGCGTVGLGVARVLLEASRLGAQGRVVVIDSHDDSEGVLVRDDDGTTRVEALSLDETQMLVALRGKPTFTEQMILTARDLTFAPEWRVIEGKWESQEERRAHWQQSRWANNRKFQSMQAKARRR
jgi:homoserine dehydrogenase